MHKHQYAATTSVPMHDDVTTYCTPQKKDANWSWGSDQTFLGLEPEPGGYGHWVVCMPCAQMLVSPLCDTCPGICLERSLRLKVSVEVASGDRAQVLPFCVRESGMCEAKLAEPWRLTLRWSTRGCFPLCFRFGWTSAPLPGLLGAQPEAHRPGQCACEGGTEGWPCWIKVSGPGRARARVGPAYPTESRAQRRSRSTSSSGSHTWSLTIRRTS